MIMAIRPYAGNSYNDQQLRQLVKDMEKEFPAVVAGFKAAFKAKPFVYGTSGRQGGHARLANIMVNSINAGFSLKGNDGQMHAVGAPPKEKLAKIFQAGVRQKVQRSGNLQMMDMYYGDKGDGGNLGDRADKDILIFVIYAAKLRFLPGWQQHKPATWPAGVTSRQNHPYDILREMGIPRGWETTPMTDAAYGKDDWEQLGMSATKEISRVIRWGVAEYGGTIIFEGSEVYYDQVFSRKPRLADTDLEARVFFQLFEIQHQSSVAFGKNGGRVIFHWNGKETKPSKLLFLTSWQWSARGAEQWYKINTPEAFNPKVLGNFKSNGPVQANPMNAPGRWNAVANFRNAMQVLGSEITYRDLWDNFPDLPQGVTPVQIPKWLDDLTRS
jgi:hypothetical protein